jgi:RHS repeat-associated protein
MMKSAPKKNDANNNLTQFTDRRGKIDVFNYDGLNRRTFLGFGKSGNSYESTISYTYDAANRLTQAVDSMSGTVTRGYDNLDHLTSETTPQGSMTYAYDNYCRRTSFTPPGQPAVNYSYDNANRLTQISQNTTTISFTYDASSRRTTLTLPNGITTSYSYDNASELTGLTYATASNMLGTLAYSYDLAGRRTTLAGSYARMNIPLAISTTAYNAANRLTTLGTANLFYDANGNMTSDGTHSYTWDARNHLISIDGGNTASFIYDPFGRRVNKSILGTTTTFAYDGANPVQEVIGGSNVANSLMGGIDEVFQRTDSTGVRDFLTDGLRSTLALTDSSGTLQTQYTFDPFGNTTVSGSSTTNSFAFTGRELDPTGLYFYRARYHSPALQRFVSEDPLGFQGGLNFYSYVGNNSVNFIDPTGLDPNPVGGGHACTRNNEPTICVTNWTPYDPGWVFFQPDPPDPPATGGGTTEAGPGGFGHIWGVHTEHTTCYRATAQPIFGQCDYICEGEDGASALWQVSQISLIKACGPIALGPDCPKVVKRVDKVLWVFGIGIPLGESIAGCSP